MAEPIQKILETIERYGQMELSLPEALETIAEIAEAQKVKTEKINFDAEQEAREEIVSCEETHEPMRDSNY